MALVSQGDGRAPVDVGVKHTCGGADSGPHASLCA